MLNINSIINSFNINEQQKFISYLKQKNKRKDTKNIQLFALLAQGETNSEVICNKLYSGDNKNAYHALRKRLVDALIDYTANKNLADENSVDMKIIKYLLASRTFLLQKNYELAYKLLDRAEHLADEHSLFPILNEIYHTKIQYAPDYPTIDLNLLIKKQIENQKRHQLEDQLNILYSKLKLALNTINYKAQDLDFETVLNKSLNDINLKLDESLSFKSLYQILAVSNISAFVTTKYYEIEPFVLKSYDIVKRKKETDKQLFYQIHIVYIIANTLFRNRKFSASLNYIDEMEQLMRSKKEVHYNDFVLKHTLVKALNLNYNNSPDKAISLVELIINKKHNDIEAILDLHLSLLMFYFQQENYKKAKSILAKFYHTDQWYIEKAGIDWILKKNIAELLLYIELKEENLFYSRLRSFKKRYKKYLADNNKMQVLDFLKIAEMVYLNIDNKAELGKLKIMKQLNNRNNDIFVTSIYAWLKSKQENTPLYQTTLRLLK